MLNYIIIVSITIPILPLLFIKGLIIQHKVKKIPEAQGDSGMTGEEYEKEIYVLIMGESSMAGVGILKHENGFAGTLAKELSHKLKSKVYWKVYVKRGLTVQQITQQIIPEIKETRFDLIVTGIGGNDAFALRNPRKWEKHINLMIDELQKRFDNVPIAFLNLPPIKDFPAFSKVLRFTLGNLAELLSYKLKHIIEGKPKVYFNHEIIRIVNWMQKYNVENKVSFFSDGVHPSEFTFQIWSKDFSDFLLRENVLK